MTMFIYDSDCVSRGVVACKVSLVHNTTPCGGAAEPRSLFIVRLLARRRRPFYTRYTDA